MNPAQSRRRPGRPPKAESGDTKAALLDAALRLFAKHGYAGTSIRAIAREVGLSESVLYAHFAGKAAVYQAAMSLVGPQAALVALSDGPGEPAEFVQEFAVRLLALWDTPRSRQVASLVSRDGLMHEEALAAGIEEALTGLAGVIAGWRDTGRIRADLGTPEDLAYTLLGPIAHARMLWLHDEATESQRETARHRITAHAAFFARALTLPAP